MGKGCKQAVPSNDFELEGKRVLLMLLSEVDSCGEIVEIARQHCAQSGEKSSASKKGDLTSVIGGSLWTAAVGAPDPELILNFSGINSTLGFPPWHLRVSSILNSGSLRGMTNQRFTEYMYAYGGVQQRYGT